MSFNEMNTIENVLRYYLVVKHITVHFGSVAEKTAEYITTKRDLKWNSDSYTWEVNDV